MYASLASEVNLLVIQPTPEPQHGKCRNLPSIVATERREQSLAFCLVERSISFRLNRKLLAEEFRAIEVAHELLLLAGASQHDSEQVLHGALTCGRSFLGGDGVRNTTFKVNVLLLCFVRQREEGIPRNAAIP